MESNLLHDVGLDSQVYRIFPLSRFLHVLSDRQLALVRPEFWEDPFESFLFQAKVKVGSEEAGLESLRAKLYGQCWMECAESDAMWRIYSAVPKMRTAEPLTDAVGVKVRSTVRKLFTALYKSNGGKVPELCFWAGRVNYLTQDEMDAIGTDDETMAGLMGDGTAKGHARSLLLKRDAFAHENEVRFIFDANDGYDFENEPVYLFGIEPIDVFEEVILDPRLSPEHCEQLRDRIRHAGYGGPISQSSLYKPPRYTFRLA